MLLVYYQCDTASYTKDAGGYSFLEKLFEYEKGKKVFDEEKKMLKFSTKYQKMYTDLELELFNE